MGAAIRRLLRGALGAAVVVILNLERFFQAANLRVYGRRRDERAGSVEV